MENNEGYKDVYGYSLFEWQNYPLRTYNQIQTIRNIQETQNEVDGLSGTRGKNNKVLSKYEANLTEKDKKEIRNMIANIKMFGLEEMKKKISNLNNISISVKGE